MPLVTSFFSAVFVCKRNIILVFVCKLVCSAVFCVQTWTAQKEVNRKERQRHCVLYAEGVVVCYGQGCRVHFSKTVFSRCTLVVLAGTIPFLVIHRIRLHGDFLPIHEHLVQT